MGISIMANLFDLVKLYASDWTATAKRKFTPKEIEFIQGVTVVASKYGKSACFISVKGKYYIPVEPTAAVNIGDSLKMDNLEIVELKYTGTNADQKVTHIFRIRVTEEETPVTSFSNPFGL